MKSLNYFMVVTLEVYNIVNRNNIR